MSITLRALVLLVLPCALEAAGFEAGAARVDITPSTPIRLSGYGSRRTVSEGIDQPIAARALVLRDPAGTLSAIVSIDAIGIPAHLRERICGAIRAPLGIYRVRVAVGATHTHYAPHLAETIVNLSELTPAESKEVDEYTRQVTAAAIEAVRTAARSLAPVKLVYGAGTAGFAANRRTDGGPVDRELAVLAALRADGSPAAIVFNYACHATTIPASRNRVSGDWPGYGAADLDAAYPGCVTLPLIGCGGDANPSPRGKLSQSKDHGREIAARVRQVLEKGTLSAIDQPLDAQFEYVDLRWDQVPTREELEARLAAREEHIRRHARLLIETIERRGRLPATHRYPVQLWSFGDQLTMVFLAGEVVVDYALRLKRELAEKRLWITAYANALPGYIASRRVLAEGGYEADGSMVWYGRPGRWHPSVEDTIVEKVKELAARAGALDARIKPPPALSPEAALESFRLLDGLRIELAASEPQVVDPVAIAFDEAGVLYAAEMRDYPLGPGRGQPPDGRVRRLEDRDGDGRYERSSVLAEHVPYPNGIACWKGGVFVTCAPDLLYLKDTTGDGRADVRQVTYTGFARGNSQHLVNTIEWGPDNRFHVLGGDRGDITSPVRPDFKTLELRWSSLRFDPLSLDMEPESGYHGGYGIAFAADGRRIICSSTNHALEVVIERRYLSRNPHLRISGVTASMWTERPDIYPAARPLERFNDPSDSGRFSSACGVHVYLGDALPEAFRGHLFVAEPVSNLVHHDRLVPSGSTLRTERVEPGREFLASADYWFRPVSVTTGPDGALYVVDMYREVIEHPEWIPAHVQKLFDLRSGMDRGRIYRVVAGESARSANAGALARATTAELVAELGHASDWRRRTARRLLVERQDAAAVPSLRALLREASSPMARLAALWTLAGLRPPGAPGLTADDLLAALADPAPEVRASGAVLAEQWLESREGAGEGAAAASSLLAGVAALARDASPRVRFQAALSLSFAAEAARTEPLLAIALRDAADRWTRTAVLAAWPGSPAALIGPLVSAGLEEPGRAELVGEAAELAGRRGRSREQVECLALLLQDDAALADAPRRAALTRLLRAMGTSAVARLLAGDPAPAPAALRPGLERLFRDSARRAADDEAPLEDRLAALELLACDGSARVVGLLAPFLSSRYPQEVQLAAVGGLGRVAGDLEEEATRVLIERYSDLTPPVRAAILAPLIEAPRRVAAFLAALEDGRARAREVDLASRGRLVEFPDAGLRERARALFAGLGNKDRAAVIERYLAAFRAAGFEAGADEARGKALFVENCSTCHRVGDVGHAVGPDLVGLEAKTPEALLIEILDPNRAVEGKYTGYSIVSRDGRVQTGLLVAETPHALVLRRAGGETATIRRQDVLELESTGLSVMPEGLEEALDVEKMRDLIAFLRGGVARLE